MYKILEKSILNKNTIMLKILAPRIASHCLPGQFTILKVNEGLAPEVMTNVLEIKLLDFLGISLNLDSCIKCGDTKNIVTIDADQGGFICGSCHINQHLLS